MPAEGAKRGECSSQADFLQHDRTERLGVVGLEACQGSGRDSVEPK